MSEESPFIPGRPVPATAFSGRKDAVEKLLDTAQSTCRGNFRVAYISGERGIGKSSLAQMVRHLAERDLKMATAYTSLGGVDDLPGLARMTLQSIVQDNDNKPWIGKVKDVLGERIKQIGMFGVNFELDMPKKDLQGIVDNFADQMGGLLRQIGEDRQGLMLILDDINGLAEHAVFTHWLKSTVDGVAVSNRDAPPVFLLLAGLEERRQQMISHNPSVARIFQPMLFVEPWKREETRNFFENGFERGGVKLSPDAIDTFVIFSGGLPMAAQEIGHAAWVRKRKGEDPMLGISDAADAIGRQYLESSVEQALHNDSYRTILHRIRHGFLSADTFSLDELREKINLSSDEAESFDNFIERMLKLGAVLPDRISGKQGVYRFPSLLHRLCFIMVSRTV